MSGKTIGRYEIMQELGRGGMATVYLGFDPKLERKVAIKVLPSQFANDPEFFERFEKEAKTLATLQHNAIVSLYDSGEDEGFPYFIMQLMDGGSLKEKITDGELQSEEIITIFSRIAGALDKAHSTGIVHRDVKPSNILFDDDNEAYLSDFGIVKLTQAADTVTRTGGSVGTPHYMSPEQLDGVADLDGRADIYALAVVLYETLVGDPPYNHPSSPRIMVMHLNEPIPNILEKRPDLPPAIAAIIKKGMAKERDERYSKASELANDLKAALQNWVPGGDPTAESEPSLVPIQPETTAAETKPENQPETTATSNNNSAKAEQTQAASPAKQDGGSGDSSMPWLYALAGAGGVALLVLAVIGIVFLRNNSDEVTPTATTRPTQVAVIEPTDPPTEEATERPTATPADTSTPRPTATLAPVVVSTQLPSATPRATETSEPTATATEIATNPPPTETPVPKASLDDALIALEQQENVLLFEDLFENNQGTLAEENIVFEDGSLILTGGSRLETIAFLPFEKSPDGTYVTELEFIDGLAIEEGWAGVILRVSSSANDYYLFEINGSGFFRGSYITGSSESMRIREFETGRINLGYKTTNKLEIDISEGSAEVYINESGPVATFKDSFLTTGGIGLISRVDRGSNSITARFLYLTYK